MVTISQVANVLLPWLGSRLLDTFRAECDTLAKLLNSPRERQMLPQLSQKLAVYLYGQVKRATCGRMVVIPDGGYPIQMRAGDFSIIADDLLFLVFQDSPVDAEHLLWIRQFSMQQPSLAALRARYTRFHALETAEELQTIAQIARDCYPAFRLQGWLDVPHS